MTTTDKPNRTARYRLAARADALSLGDSILIGAAPALIVRVGRNRYAVDNFGSPARVQIAVGVDGQTWTTRFRPDQMVGVDRFAAASDTEFDGL